MKGYFAFFKKEWTEHFRTFRAVILLAAFFLFGLMSPLFAKLTPELLASIPMDGITIEIPSPTALDAYVQLFKNTTQMGFIVLLLVFGGLLSSELSRGTLVLPLAHGLSRTAVVLSKFSVSLLLWTASLLVSVLINEGYTRWLFQSGPQAMLWFSIFCLWLFGALLLSLVLLSGVAIPGSFGGLVLPVLALGVLFLLELFPALHTYNPLALASDNVALLTGAAQPGGVVPASLIAAGTILLSLAGSVLLFRKKII